MLYILKNDKKQSAWQEIYELCYQTELLQFKIPYKVIELDDIYDLKKNDFLWVMHYEDILKVKDTKAVVISQSNGTSANPYIYQVNHKEEVKQMKIIKMCLVFNARHKQVMEQMFPKNKFFITGFPVYVKKSKAKKIANTIAVVGRISPDKQFYLSTFLLQPLVDEGYQVTFCVPGKEEDNQWLKIYHKDNFIKQGFKIKFLSRNSLLKELSKTEFIFLSSLGDILSVSLTEALMCGCYPIVPKFNNGLPTYDDYVSVGYEPFSQKSVINLIEKKPQFTWQSKYTNSTWCVMRFIKFMHDYESTLRH